MWNVRHVLEGFLRVSVRVFLLQDDVLCMRTTAVKWSTAGLYGPSAELHYVLMKKDEKKSTVVLHRRGACWSFSLKIRVAGKARLRSEPNTQRARSR